MTLLDQLQSVDVTQDVKDVGPLGEGVWIGIMGPKRTGKGLLATNLALQAALKGVEVYHFGNLKFGTNLNDALELLEGDPASLRNGLIVFDEVKAHAQSTRQASTVTLLLENLMTQTGHFNVSVIWTTTSQSGLHRVFREQTQWMYWVDYKYITKDAIFDNRPKGMGLKEGWAKGLTNKCEGFATPELDECDEWWYRHRQAHQGPPGLIDCREAKINIRSRLQLGKHGIRYLFVSQESSPHGAGGKREFGHLRCAQRFYGLNKTDFFVSSVAMLTTGSDDVKQAAAGRDTDVIRAAVYSMVSQGIETEFPAEVREFIKRSADIDYSANRVGHVLSQELGIPRTRKSARGKQDTKTPYNLAGWVKQHPL